MKKFRVWFDQVNIAMYDVTAKDEDDAVRKATKQWKKEHSTPKGIPEVIELPIDIRECSK